MASVAFELSTDIRDGRYRRTPVLIFLSDGEHQCGDEAMYDICRSAVRHGFAVLLVAYTSYLQR
jgi:hypothetical protein